MSNFFNKEIKIKNDNLEIEFSEEEIKDNLIRKERRKTIKIITIINFIFLIFSFFAPYFLEIKEIYLPMIMNSQIISSGIVLAYITGNTIERIKGK